MICSVCGLDCGLWVWWIVVEVVGLVGCGGGCGLWRFWVVVEVVACFVGFMVVGVG